MRFGLEFFWVLKARASFRAIFSIAPSFALFKKMRVLSDLAKTVITWAFGHFWSRCLRPNVVQSLHFKSILIRG